VRFYFNEASIQGQFEDPDAFRTQMEALLSARRRSPVLASMRTTPVLADRHVSPGRTLREVVQSWRGSPTAAALLAWVGKTGPFIEEDRLPETEDLFMCFGIEVTEGGLGEAARRLKALEDAGTMSFAGGEPDFARSPLPVTHGFEDNPIACYDVLNYWTVDELIAFALDLRLPPVTWRETIEAARDRFPGLILPNAIYEDTRLARDPFDAVLRDRIFVLLGILDRYMAMRGADGMETAAAQEVIRTHFSGNRALFSPESLTNQRDYKTNLTFPDPLGGSAIFAHWHGKISHRVYRLHFEWPVPANASKLKVLYIGPKLTKN
jgi:hypothetical protein